MAHIPSAFGSKWVVGYQVVGVLRVPRIKATVNISFIRGPVTVCIEFPLVV